MSLLGLSVSLESLGFILFPSRVGVYKLLSSLILDFSCMVLVFQVQKLDFFSRPQLLTLIILRKATFESPSVDSKDYSTTPQRQALTLTSIETSTSRMGAR